MFKIAAAATAAVTLGLAGAANATTVNFDDLHGLGQVAEGYGGIVWNGGWNYYDFEQDPYNPSSGGTRVYTTQCCSYTETSFSFAAPVTYNGAYFAGRGSNEGYGPISFNLYNNGALVHSTGGIDLSGTPTFLASGYAGNVDRVGVVGTQDFYIMDDVTYGAASAAPEPAAWALMIAGFGLAGGAVRRRKALVA